MKRLLIFATVAALAVSSATHAAEPPQRIMSLSLCTDQLLLQLVSKDRITSVTYLSRSSEYSYLSTEAEAVARRILRIYIPVMDQAMPAFRHIFWI